MASGSYAWKSYDCLPHPTSLCGIYSYTSYQFISGQEGCETVTTAVGLEAFACAGIPESLEGCSTACLSCCCSYPILQHDIKDIKEA